MTSPDPKPLDPKPLDPKPLDPRDQRLLALLRADARTPVAALAKAVNLSRSATQDRLKRLEASGWIEGYTIRTRPPEGGVQAWLMLKLKPDARCAEVVPHVLARPEVRLVHSLAGEVDILAWAVATTPEGLSALREAVSELAGVERVTTAPVMAVHG
jgi:DNA-binding Lrp family transcriptional regulator